MASLVLGIAEVGRDDVDLVGAKGATLGELSRLEGLRVPPGFCVTTHAYRRAIAVAPSFEQELTALSRLRADDHEAIRARSARVRAAIAGRAAPDDVAEAIASSLAPLGDGAAFAVRSSATAEDLPRASFAGQHGTYLNVLGSTAVIDHVRRCWASLFTERAVAYRLRNGIDHRDVQMAVVVQQLVDADAAGVAFTADPVTSNRRVVVIESTFGLGEAVVDGRGSVDIARVRDGAIVDQVVGAKRRALVASSEGGAREEEIDPARQREPALTDGQILQIAATGRQIEAHFGQPQDIEWCVTGGELHVVQARPITTLFPIPEVGDGARHVFVSVGHQQMMTDPMRPLGLSFWQLTAMRQMYAAAGRPFVDVIDALASPARTAVIDGLGRSDPLIGGALQQLVDRGDVVPASAGDLADGAPTPRDAPEAIATDASIVADLVARHDESLARLERAIAGASGDALFDVILDDLEELQRLLRDPQRQQALMAGFEATWWLNDHLLDWLGEPSAADALARAAPGNVTSEMGLDLLDVADAVRPHPEAVALLEGGGDDFLDRLAGVEGGAEARDAIVGFLDRYGMRCVGEIDITRPRWRERPTTLVPLILANIRNFAPGERERRVEGGRAEAARKEREILERLRALPDGDRKAEQTRQMVARLRTFVGFREHPKFAIVNRYFVYKQALLREARTLVEAGVLDDVDDVSYLTFDELREVVRTGVADHEVIARRKDEHRSYAALVPPRVMTSDGEVIEAAYRRDGVPAGALVGIPVSAGRVEGRARVVRDLDDAMLEPGDVLVTRCTDPSWSPLFVGVAGLVTEVGGATTHGAVVAREYGLPAVVGVDGATELIRDGQRVVVHGSAGYVELLDP